MHCSLTNLFNVVSDFCTSVLMYSYRLKKPILNSHSCHLRQKLDSLMINESDPDSKPSANPHISVHNMSLICKFMYGSMELFDYIMLRFIPSYAQTCNLSLRHKPTRFKHTHTHTQNEKQRSPADFKCLQVAPR